MKEDVSKLMYIEEIQSALEFVKEDADNTLEEQKRFSEIPAPTFEEQQLGQYYYELMCGLDLDEVTIDDSGNVIGVLKGEQDQPGILTMAHLDTVFPRETDVTVKEQNGILYSPGISDNCRNLAAQLSMIRGFNKAGIKPKKDIIFTGNICEEGLGDLKGARILMNRYPEVDGVVAFDGTGMGIQGIVYGATGSKRYQVTYRGPGGHSFGVFGKPSAIHALGRAINKISQIQVPDTPKTTFNVGEIKGGTSVNTIAADASMLIDLRSNSKEELAKLENKFLELTEEARQEEVKQAQTGDDERDYLSLETKLVGNRPAGMQDEDAKIVQAAVEATRVLGVVPQLKGAGSTDANIPISMGIPAVCISGGGQSGGAHTLEEWFDPTEAYLGVQRGLLLLMYLAGISQ